MSTSRLPKTLLSVTVKTMAYLCNRSLPQASNGTTPLEHITGEKPDLVDHRIFGCQVSVALLKEKKQRCYGEI